MNSDTSGHARVSDGLLATPSHRCCGERRRAKLTPFLHHPLPRLPISSPKSDDRRRNAKRASHEKLACPHYRAAGLTRQVSISVPTKSRISMTDGPILASCYHLQMTEGRPTGYPSRLSHPVADGGGIRQHHRGNKTFGVRRTVCHDDMTVCHAGVLR
ncbi:hypothetical protein LZ30DRAFT_257008 [Colletotrichum cereale]|nr:hypothetical protein LZ30DRAFT_257008 [Colletotrichum cereale]